MPKNNNKNSYLFYLKPTNKKYVIHQFVNLLVVNCNYRICTLSIQIMYVQAIISIAINVIADQLYYDMIKIVSRCSNC